jgi:hypothetical protein
MSINLLIVNKESYLYIADENWSGIVSINKCILCDDVAYYSLLYIFCFVLLSCRLV